MEIVQRRKSVWGFYGKFSLAISKGNSKLFGIPNFSLPPEFSCPLGVPCAHDCYAKPSYHRFPQVKKMWTNNFKTVIQTFKGDNFWYPQEFEAVMITLIKSINPERFRIHVSGDYDLKINYASLRYMCAWERIAYKLPNVKFLAYTKTDLPYDTDIPNLTYYWSAWNNWKVRSDLHGIAWTKDQAILDNRIPLSTPTCHTTCDKCSYCWQKGKQSPRQIIFENHSAWRAKK